MNNIRVNFFSSIIFSASAALHNVPAESAISSSKIQVLSLTSPIIFITSDSPAFSLLLSAIARPAFNLFAKALALTTPPTSGDATTNFYFH